jgi:two-component system, OmpR family, osmolarity sensor histidine kinase EnvZ
MEKSPDIAADQSQAPATPAWLRWLDPAHLEKIMPRTLMARATLTIIVPVILVQVISTYVFYDNHWDVVSRRMAADLAGDITAVQSFLDAYLESEDQVWMIENARRAMALDIAIQSGAEIGGPDVIDGNSDLTDPLHSALWQALHRPFTVDFFEFRTDRLVSIRVQMESGVLTVLVPRRRILNNNTYVFVLWMTGSSLLLFGVATAYLRSQVRTVRRLAQAADSLGKGREGPDFPAEGAFEVRQAARAFNIMRDRIQRQITQRTDMLAGVSHDLRTPLTRMKLQLSMMSAATAEDIAALHEDLSEMERMLEAYLAFARGDGAEEAVPTNLMALLESVVQRFRREGSDITLKAENIPQSVALKAVAFERCLGNLVGNASRYGKHVVVTASQTGAFIQVEVDDDGPGIPRAQREDAFKAFHRLEPSRNPMTGGVGLGMTIARDVVRGMGGEITLGDSPTGGLRVTVRFPL